MAPRAEPARCCAYDYVERERHAAPGRRLGQNPNWRKNRWLPQNFRNPTWQFPYPKRWKEIVIEKMEDFQVVAYAGELYYQVRVKKDAPHIYLSATDGRELEKGEERYAVKLAFEMLGDANAQITHREFITQFSEKYRASAKVLPVYCIMLKDENHTSIFIDTWNRKVTFADNNSDMRFINGLVICIAGNFSTGIRTPKRSRSPLIR
jgi:hypothetical protein